MFFGFGATLALGPISVSFLGAIQPGTFLRSGVAATVKDLSFRNIAEWWNDNQAQRFAGITIPEGIINALNFIVINAVSVSQSSRPSCCTVLCTLLAHVTNRTGGAWWRR